MIVALLDYLGWPWSPKVFFGDDSLNDLLLFFAFVAAFYYAWITNKMWQINKDPMLRLQFNDLGRDEYFKRLKTEKEFLYNTYTDLQLVNDGNGSAKNVMIVTKSLVGKDLPKIRNVTAIGSKGSTQLRYDDWGKSNRSREFNNEDRSYAEPYQVTIKFDDVQGGKHTRVFKVNEHYNDGFKIIK